MKIEKLEIKSDQATALIKGNEYYVVNVNLAKNEIYCSCPDHFYRKRPCKHIKLVLESVFLNLLLKEGNHEK